MKYLPCETFGIDSREGDRNAVLSLGRVLSPSICLVGALIASDNRARHE